MKISALIMALWLLLVALPSAAFAGDPLPSPVVPEPSAILIWAGVAGAGGVAYWWRNRRLS